MNIKLNALGKYQLQLIHYMAKENAHVEYNGDSYWLVKNDVEYVRTVERHLVNSLLNRNILVPRMVDDETSKIMVSDEFLSSYDLRSIAEQEIVLKRVDEATIREREKASVIKDNKIKQIKKFLNL